MAVVRKDFNIAIIKWALTFILPSLVFLVPISDIYTSTMRTFLVITVFCISLIAFEFFDMIIPGILLPSLYLVTNVAPASIIFSPWAGSMLFMIIGAFLMANIMEECGLLRRISYWCIKTSGGTFNGTVYGCLVASVIISAMTFTNGFLIIATLILGVSKAMNIKKTDKESAILCMAGIFGVLTVQAYTYFPAFVGLMQSGAQTLIPDFVMPWYSQVIYNWPLFVLSVLFLWGMTKIYKTKEIKFEYSKQYFAEEYNKLGKMSSAEKKTAFVFCLMLVYLCTSSFHKLDANYAFMFLPWALYLPGVNVGSTRAIKNLNLGLILFIAACMGIGSVGIYIGTGNLIATIITPLLADSSNAIALLAFLFFGMIANLFMTPYAMMGCFPAPVTQIALDLGINPIGALLALNIGVDAVIFPYETTPTLVVFGFGMMKMSEFIKFNIIKVILTFIFVAVVMIPYWNLMGVV